jgi:uncharacterized membrane protein YGL010W
MLTAARARVLLAGVDFSQVDLSPLYLRIGLALAVLHLVSLAAIPARLVSPRLRRTWRSSLVALLALGWATVFVGFRWPELIRGRDLFNLFSLVGGLVVAPLVTLAASLAIWLLRRRGRTA